MTTKQLLRRPIRSLSGVLLVALAVAVLITGVGQTVAAFRTERELLGGYITLAIETGKNADTKGYTEWLSSAIEENPHLVRAVETPMLASATIPELDPDMVTDHAYDNSRGWGELVAYPDGEPYTTAVVEITVIDISDPIEGQTAWLNGPQHIVTAPYGIEVQVLGSIDRVVGLAEGFPDPIDMNARITFCLPDIETFESYDLKVGERYLVYTMCYQETDWELRHSILDGYRPVVEKFDPEKLSWVNEEFKLTFENRAYNQNAEFFSGNPYRVARYDGGMYMYPITNYQIGSFNTIKMRVADDAAMPYYETIYYEDGTRGPGNLLYHSEEYIEKYTIPTFASLGEMTAEEFLESDAGEDWREVLGYVDVLSHAFPMIGVDNLEYIVEFARGNARIAEGRTFTEEEISNGAKVCVMSKTLAEKNGIKVGDTINPHFYDYDPESVHQIPIEKNGVGSVHPMPYFFTATTPFHGDPIEYTVVGLYEQINEWAPVQDNGNAFTPNTIFVPGSSIESSTATCNYGFFKNIILENGMVTEWSKLVTAAGYDGCFAYYDGGYTDVADIFFGYRDLAAQTLLVGVVVWAIICLLFLVMFPWRQGKTLTLMDSIGAKRGKKMSHVVWDSLAIFIPGTLAGVGLGALLWQKVTARLLEASGASLDIKLPPSAFAAAAVAQLLIMAVLIVASAWLLTRRRDLMKRK